MNHFGMFAKYWEVGSVKTRLASKIGGEAASEIYFECLAVLIDRFASFADIRTLAYTPVSHMAKFTELAGTAWTLGPQSTGHLGRRMSHFFESAFQGGAERVILIGSDSPHIPRSWLEQSWQILRDNEVVLGPTADGGYYLIGMSRFEPELFRDIRWSSSYVMDDTRSRVRDRNLSVGELPDWYDIDEFEDLHRLRRDLKQDPPGDTDWTKLLSAIDAVI
ncbi:MAG: TIGR04282 family arsenosugar biosynthesis glycosyltransferase [Pirellulaceae bacterium]|nr:TIGR04282 family arsenosugar biosynthesis glycosyltransferase [Pirellulaceae bacterium]